MIRSKRYGQSKWKKLKTYYCEQFELHSTLRLFSTEHSKAVAAAAGGPLSIFVSLPAAPLLLKLSPGCKRFFPMFYCDGALRVRRAGEAPKRDINFLFGGPPLVPFPFAANAVVVVGGSAFTAVILLD
jgi:hypothetical protein